MKDSQKNCPCANNQSYLKCCRPLHLGQAFASTAEQLMRSRFSAFYLAAKGELDLCQYLLDTWHHSQYQDPAQALVDLKHGITEQQYYSLRILDTKAGMRTDIKGEVEFVVFFTTSKNTNHEQKNIQQLHERSHFIKENDRWFYVDGEFCPDIKLQRNDVCWCGSAKKFKKCHA